jgi:hypothetical protein
LVRRRQPGGLFFRYFMDGPFTQQTLTAMLWLTLLSTAITVALLMRFFNWVAAQRRERPEFHRQGGAMFMLLQILLDLPRLF